MLYLSVLSALLETLKGYHWDKETAKKASATAFFVRCRGLVLENSGKLADANLTLFYYDFLSIMDVNALGGWGQNTCTIEGVP